MIVINDGKPEYSIHKSQVEHVMSIIKGNKKVEKQLIELYDNHGWRLHHFYHYEKEHKCSWLDFALKYNPGVPLMKILTIDEHSLLHNKDYKVIFHNCGYRSNLLTKYYGNFKCLIKSDEILNYIDELEKETDNYKLKKEFQDLRTIFIKELS